MEKKRVAVLFSGRGSNMMALAEATRQDGYPAEIAVAICNRPQAAGLEKAREFGIETRVIDHKEFADRASFDDAIHSVLTRYGIDLVCLAGFMRLFTPEFVELWRDRMINIHPALLPLYKGLNTHERALADGVKLHGATVHFVRPEMDVGPIIAQGAVPVWSNDTPDTLAKRVLNEIEHHLYPLALRLVAEGRARIAGERVEIDNDHGVGSLVGPRIQTGT